MAQVTIYGLCDPVTHEVRYVGQSVAPRKRLSAHLNEASGASRTHKANWLRSVNLAPDLTVLDVVDADMADEAEQSWIATFPRLTNVNQGGGGNRGWKASSVTRERMSAAAKRRCSDATERERLRSITNRRPPRRIGEANNAVLTENDVREMRRLHKDGMSGVALAHCFGVTPANVSLIVNRRTWNHVAAEGEF